MLCLDFKAQILPSIGGMKAARLSSISNIPIPISCVLPSYHYIEHVADLPLEDLLIDLNPLDIESLLKVSSEIKTLICDKPLLTRPLFSIPLSDLLAIRSSSIQEDLLGLSFAGQYDSFLNVENNLDQLEKYIKLCWASLYTPRAMSYRHHNGLTQTNLSMAVLIQNMIEGISGVLLSTKNEFIIEFSKHGVVDGKTNGEHLIIKDKSAIKDFGALSAKNQELLINYTESLFDKFGVHLDLEWVLSDHLLYLVQVRPFKVLKDKYTDISVRGIPILFGSAVGFGTLTGVVQKAQSPRDKIKKGMILVVKDTSPDWEPLMRQARALITDHGCRTSHASLVANEMGLPAVVGTTEATFCLTDGQIITIQLGKETGFVYGGACFEEISHG